MIVVRVYVYIYHVMFTNSAPDQHPGENTQDDANEGYILYDTMPANQWG